MQVDQLNEQFGLADTLSFAAHHSRWPIARIGNQFATAEIHLYAAHVTHFQPHGQEPVLWLSPDAVYREGKAIRGGIPVIWPWFGPHPVNSTLPQHGFGRNRFWQVASTKQHDDGRTAITLQLEDDAETRPLWPDSFCLALTITVGQSLTVELAMTHLGDDAVSVTAALHSYFTVGDIKQLSVTGLEETPYLNKTTGYTRHQQAGAVTFTGETDRVYLQTTADCLIHDPVLNRVIRVRKQGSRSTVVWNPWVEKAEGMGDFPDEGYKTMVCVETTNATAEDEVMLPPAGTHKLVTEISVEPFMK